MEKVRVQNIKTGRLIDLSRKAVDLLKANGQFENFDELGPVTPGTPLLSSKPQVTPETEVVTEEPKLTGEGSKEEEKVLTFDELTSPPENAAIVTESEEVSETPVVTEGKEFVDFEVIDKSKKSNSTKNTSKK